MSQYLRGRIPLNLSALIKLSKALNVVPEAISPRLAAQMQQMLPSADYTTLQVEQSPRAPYMVQKVSAQALKGILEGVIKAAGYSADVQVMENGGVRAVATSKKKTPD